MLQRIRELAVDDFGILADGVVAFGPRTPDHDLHVVVGDSGAGKTTLCHALRFALYGTARSVSAASVSIPAHETADGPATATVSAALDAPDGRYRVERTLTESTSDRTGETTVGPPQVQRRDGTAWLGLDDPDTAVGRLAPPETEQLLLNDPGLHRTAGPAGWTPFVQGRLVAAAAAKSTLDDRAVSPAELWAEFRDRLDAYVDLVGPAPRYEGAAGAEPFEIRVPSDDDSAAPGAGTPTGESIRFALAITLAAGDCAELPQWFDAPLGRLDEDARASAIEGFEAASERRQIVLLPHQASLVAHPGLTRHVATGHRLELVDEYRAEISELESN